MNEARSGRAAGAVVTGRGSVVLWLAVVFAISTCGTLLAQQNVPSNAGVGTRPIRNNQQEMDQSLAANIGGPLYQERRLRQLNLAQHKAMVSDTDKLLKLVTDLNAEISSSNPDALSPDQLRKVAEIEKLAHSVKDKMRTAAQGGQDFLNATPALPVPQSRH